MQEKLVTHQKRLTNLESILQTQSTNTNEVYCFVATPVIDLRSSDSLFQETVQKKLKAP